MKIRIPTIDDYRLHDGLHYKNLWRDIPDNWICPACGRSKFQIMRWTKRFPNSPDAFMGWVAALHRHHDHSVSQWANRTPRFSASVICDQCNSADGAAKRRLKLPAKFSFSPSEIGTFISATPHGKHVLNFAMAQSVYFALAVSNQGLQQNAQAR